MKDEIWGQMVLYDYRLQTDEYRATTAIVSLLFFLYVFLLIVHDYFCPGHLIEEWLRHAVVRHDLSVYELKFEDLTEGDKHCKRFFDLIDLSMNAATADAPGLPFADPPVTRSKAAWDS